MEKQKNGLLIVVEGIDGCGKSTFIKNLEQLLLQHKLPHIVTKEPGATELGQQLRTIIMKKEVPLGSKAEFLLFAADRAQHSEQVVLPALKGGTIVLSDRMGDSSLVYQGYARGLDTGMIETINAWAMNERTPDLVFYLKLDVQTAFQRIFARNEPLTSFEREKEEFMQAVKDGFETVFAKRNNVVTLDAREPSTTLAQQAIDTVLKKYEQN